jgi:hypothetical protein
MHGFGRIGTWEPSQIASQSSVSVALSSISVNYETLGSVTEHRRGLQPVIEEMVDRGEEYLKDADSPDESVV